MNLHKQLLTNNDCYKAGGRITVKGIMVHSTGANNPNLRRYVAPDDGLLGVNNNKNDWNRPRHNGNSVCVHAFIGKLADGQYCHISDASLGLSRLALRRLRQRHAHQLYFNPRDPYGRDVIVDTVLYITGVFKEDLCSSCRISTSRRKIR